MSSRKNRVREKVRSVLSEYREHGIRVTHAELMDSVDAIISYRDLPDSKHLQQQYVGSICREELEAKDANGVQLFLPFNDTGIWNDPRTYLPTSSATSEHLLRDMVLAEEGARPYIARKNRDERALALLDEHPDWTAEECLRLVIEEEQNGARPR